MRRVVVIGGFAALVLGGWLLFRPSGGQWIVAVHADNGLTYEEPCLPMDEITGGGATRGGEFNGLYEVRSRDAGEVVADCYQDNGVEAEVRTMTDADRDALDELKG